MNTRTEHQPSSSAPLFGYEVVQSDAVETGSKVYCTSHILQRAILFFPFPLTFLKRQEDDDVRVRCERVRLHDTFAKIRRRKHGCSQFTTTALWKEVKTSSRCKCSEGKTVLPARRRSNGSRANQHTLASPLCSAPSPPALIYVRPQLYVDPEVACAREENPRRSSRRVLLEIPPAAFPYGSVRIEDARRDHAVATVDGEEERTGSTDGRRRL